MIKELLFITLALASMTAFAESHLEIPQIQSAKNQARKLVSEFKLRDLDHAQEEEAPDYRYVRKAFLNDIKQKEINFLKQMDLIERALSYNLSIIERGTSKNEDRETIKLAKKRLIKNIATLSADYQLALKSFIIPHRGLMRTCLSGLCVQFVFEDLISWFETAENINKDLPIFRSNKLERLSLNKKKSNFSKEKVTRFTSEILSSLLKSRPISISRTNLQLPYLDKLGAEAFYNLKYSLVKEHVIEPCYDEDNDLCEMQRNGAFDYKISKYTPEIILKHGYGDLRKWGIENLEKYGAANLRKFALEDLTKYGVDRLQKYGLSNLDKYGAENLDKYGLSALEKYGIKLLQESPLPVLEEFETRYGLENLKMFGVANLSKFELKDLKLYGSDLLTRFGKDRIERQLQYFTISQLKVWGVENAEKYGHQNLKAVLNPQYKYLDSLIPFSWSDFDSVDEKTIICRSILGKNALALVTNNWKMHQNFPIGGGERMAKAHLSGDIGIQKCPLVNECRGWETIYCGIEK